MPYFTKFNRFLTARIAVLKRPLSRELFETFWKKKSWKSDAIIICPGQPRPWCNILVRLQYLTNRFKLVLEKVMQYLCLIMPSIKQLQTCLKLKFIMSIWNKLKLAINQLNLFQLVQVQKSSYRAVLDSFWILFLLFSAVGCHIYEFLIQNYWQNWLRYDRPSTRR